MAKELSRVSKRFGQDITYLNSVLQQMFPNSLSNGKTDDLRAFTKAYHNYKRKYVKHLSFTPDGEFLSKYTLGECEILFSATMLDHYPLEAVYIYFDTATYDEIEKDEKVTFYILCLSHKFNL